MAKHSLVLDVVLLMFFLVGLIHNGTIILHFVSAGVRLIRLETIAFRRQLRRFIREFRMLVK